MRWVQCTSGDISGQPPSARSGHSAVVASGGRLVVFGGLADKRFLGDVVVLDATSRDFAAAAAVGTHKIVLYGGWDGRQWLSDTFVLDTLTLEWLLLPLAGPSPPPRCAHTLVAIEKRLLAFGGRGAAGPTLGDLWTLKGLADDDADGAARPGPASWTQLRLSGSAPGPRCGHTMNAVGTQIVVFGGHSMGGFFTRVDVFYNDVTVLDRGTVVWKRVAISGEAPPPRAYHTLTRLAGRFVLLGGFNKSAALGDVWWLLQDGDPGAAAVRPSAGSLSAAAEPAEQRPFSASAHVRAPAEGRPPAAPRSLAELEAQADAQLLALGRRGAGADADADADAGDAQPGSQGARQEEQVVISNAREYLRKADARTFRLIDLRALHGDYSRLVAKLSSQIFPSPGGGRRPFRFFHMDIKLLRLGDVPSLLVEYNELLALLAVGGGGSQLHVLQDIDVASKSV